MIKKSYLTICMIVAILVQSIFAFDVGATETVSMNSTQFETESTVDVTPPELVSVTLSKSTLSTGEKIEVVAEAIDDVSGVEYFSVSFKGPNDIGIETQLYSFYYDDNYNKVSYADGKWHGYIEPDRYKPSGEYKISSIFLMDKAENRKYYYQSGSMGTIIPDNTKGLSIQLINTNEEDVTPPEITSLTILTNQVETPSVVEIIGEATDDVSGVEYFSVSFKGPNDIGIEVQLYSYYYDENYNKVSYGDGKFHGEIDINQYKPSGEYKISSIFLMDKAENRKYYYQSSSMGAIIPNCIKDISLQVANNGRLPDVTTGTSNGNLISQISNSASDALIAVDYSSNSTVSAGVFDAIKGTNRTVAFASDGIQWIVNGKDITSDSKPIDLKVTTKVAKNDYSEQGEQIQQITEGSNAYILQFADNGVLPGKMKVRIKLDYSMRNYLGTTGMYLYYYDPVLKEMQIIAENIDITKDNYVEFEITHCSDYVLTRGKLTNLKYVEPTDTNVDNSPSDVIINTTANAVNTGRKLDAVPKTADRTQYTLIVMMLIVSGLLMVYLGKKIADEKA